jgi:hypothetical protein
MKLFTIAVAALCCLASLAMAGEVGPNKGPCAEWGEEEYHLEVVPDAKTGTVTVYVYGNDKELAKGTRKPLPKDTKITLTIKTEKPTVMKLEAAPDKVDPEGKCSKFTAKHTVFTKEMKWAGSVSAKVNGKAYTGDFKQE